MTSLDQAGSGAERPPRTALGQTSRVLKNAGWLLAAKGLGGLFSLIYVGLAARALGAAKFGEFILILSFGQAVSNFAQFQTAQLLIKYGAAHLKTASMQRFARLILFSAMLDLLSAVASVVIVIAAVALASDKLGLDPVDQRRAMFFAISYVLSLRGTPSGILRLLDRFDVTAATESVLPAGRLVAAIGCYFLAPTIDWFLAAWIVAEIVTTVVIWIAATVQLSKREVPLRLRNLSLQGIAAENPGLWRFAWFTNITMTVTYLRQQAGTLLVGWGAGVTQAGSYRVAQQFAQAFSKPVLVLSRAVFPDLAHLAADGGPRAVMKLTARLSLLAGLVGGVAILVVSIAGKWLLVLIAGPPFASAHLLLVLLTIASAIDLWGFGQDPALLSLGRSGLVLAIRTAAAVGTIALFVLMLLSYGIEAGACAVIIGNLGNRTAMAIALRRASRAPLRAAPADDSGVDVVGNDS